MSKKCFDTIMPELSAVFNDMVNDNMSPLEIKQEAIKIILDEHKKLHGELNKFKESIGIKLTKEQKAYVSPDNFAKVDAITKYYGQKIREITNPQDIPYEQFRDAMLDFTVSGKDSSFDYRISVEGMSQKDRELAVEDLRSGKDTKRAQKLEAAIREMYDNGVVSVNRGKGTQAQWHDVKISDWFGLNDAEKSAVDEITDEEVSIINQEGITLDNLDTFKHLFNGFPYTEQDYEAVKSYLSAKSESNENIEPVSEESSNETTETKQNSGEGITPPLPPSEPVNNEGFKREQGKKSLLGRSYENLKEAIAFYGLNYEVQTHDEARATAQQIIKDLGLSTAVDAVRKNIVQDAEAAMIWAEAIDYIGEQISNETDPDTIAALEKEEASLLNEFDLRARGAGRFISSLNNIYNNSNFGYKLSERISRYKNLNNGEIPAEVEAKYQELDKKYQEVLKQIADMQEEQNKQREQQAMDNIKEETERATKREPKKTSTDKAKKIAEIIRKGKIQKPGIFMSSSPVSAIWDTAIEITAKAVEAGGRLSDAIIAGVEYIKQTDWYKNLNKDQQKEAVNSFAAGVNGEVNKEVKKPFINEDGKIIITPSLIREYVEGGIDNINDLTEAIKQDLLEEYPDVTDRQVRDAITEYGKTINPTQDEVSQQISKMKNIGRIISALEDIEAKKRPLKSGLQRRKYDTEERALQKQLREALKELPADVEARDKQLKTTLEAIKTRLKNSIEDIEREIATGEKRVANKGEVAYDEEAKALREERDRLREIRDEIFGDEVTEEQRISRALNVTERSIEQLEQKIKDNDLSFKQKQVLESPELKAARERLKKLRDTINEMREQAGIAEASRLEAAKKRVEKRIAELKTRLANKDFTKKQKRVLEADDALIKLNAEKLFVQEEYAKEEYKAELKNRNIAQKIKDGATEIWGLTRVLMATGELSFIGIQGGLFSLTHPKIAINSFAKMLSHMTSEKRFNEWERYVKSQPYYPALKASKLALSEYDSKLTAREELGVSGWANHLWDYALSPVKLVSNKGYEFLKSVNPLKAIERGGVAYMNNIRLNRFLTGMEKLQLEGKTFTTNPEDYKRMADVINTLSGRASLGKLEPNAQTLALLFFSPRNWASMIKQFPPIFFTRQMYKWRGSDGKISVAQKMAVSDYMKFVTITGGLLLAMAEYYKHDDDDDTEVIFDPTSSDFLKIRNKNTRIDVFGGRTQMMVFTMRMIFDEKTSISGKTSRLGEGMLAPNKRDLIIDMISNKLAPTAGALNEYVNTRVKKNPDGTYTRINKYTGEEYSVFNKAAESVQPIFWGTVREIHKDQPAQVAYFLDVMAAIGVNIATYIPKKKKESTDGRIRKGE